MLPKPNLNVCDLCDLENLGNDSKTNRSPQGPMGKLYAKYKFESCKLFSYCTKIGVFRQTDRKTDRQGDGQSDRKHHNII